MQTGYSHIGAAAGLEGGQKSFFTDWYGRVENGFVAGMPELSEEAHGKVVQSADLRGLVGRVVSITL